MRRSLIPALGAILLAAACGRGAFLGGGPDATTSPTPTPFPSGTPLPTSAYLRRIPITVTASSAGLPPGYALRVVFDHAALVTSSLSFADGHDLAVVAPDGTEVDRVLDSGSAWNDPATTIWYRTPFGLGPGASATWYLYFDNAAATTRPENPSFVFLFADEFESDLSRWDQSPAGYFALDSAHTHRGAGALFGPSLGNSRRWIAVKNGSETDVSVDAWWYVQDDSDDISQTLRTKVGTDDYETNYYRTCFFFSCDQGFDVAMIRNNGWSEFDGLGGSVTKNGWTRVTLQIVGQKMRVLRNGQQVVPGSGWVGVGSDHARGSFGFRAYSVGGNGWWIDDFTVRPLVDPEPQVVTGPMQTN